MIFPAFVATLLKDIRLERARITEKDKLRLLFVTKFFLDYFLALRAQEQQSQMDKDTSNVDEKWPFGLIAEVMERDWIVWVLKRMREAVDEKVNNLFFCFVSHLLFFMAAQTVERASSRHRMFNPTLTSH